MLKKTLLAAGAGLAGAILLLANVSTDYDKSVDFSRYHSYSWIDVKAGDSLWADRIRRDVDQQLQAKGWTEMPSGGDTSLTAFGSTKNQESLQTFYDTLGGGWGWRGWWGPGIGTTTTTVENTPVGTLVLDMFDSQSKKLIFRGKSTEVLSSKPDKNDKKLEKDVADMFKKFPPPPKG